jgi:TorA maturation chaperone TorD
MPETNTTNLQHKATIYRLLSACFYEPENCFLEENVFGQLREALQELPGDLAPLARQMDTSFRSTGKDKLLEDFSQLFMGPFEIPAKPYGSVYIEGEKVVMGDSTMKAKACYAEADFEVAENFKELPDHITVELEFLYLLSFRQAQAAVNADSSGLINNQRIEQSFLKNHLGRWVPDFCEQIRSHATTDYYRHLADLTEEFVLRQRD